jgi:selenocysteine-specific translation elongation factor
VSGVTAALLGNLEARREVGKVGTQSDIHLHDLKAGGRQVTIIVPHGYPAKVQPLSYAVLGAHGGVLAVKKVDAQLGEQILAADAAGLKQGVVVLEEHIQSEQVQPLLKDTVLASWPVVSDWAAAREKIGAFEVPHREGAVLVPIDHHFNVKGVGAVVLGIVRQGVLKKSDTLHAFPDKVICPVRSIQMHDVDVAEARTGDRVGLALRNTNAEHLDRGMVLAPADADLRIVAEATTLALPLRRSKFHKAALAAGTVVHLGVGMQVVPVKLAADAPAPGTEGTLKLLVERPFVHAPGERGVVWHLDVPQRVVGGVRLD